MLPFPPSLSVYVFLCFICIGRSSYSLKHEPPASQLGLFEAPHPWGPWAAFYVKQPWDVQGKPGGYLQCTQCLFSLSLFLSVCHMCILRGRYCPDFPAAFMSADGLSLRMTSSACCTQEGYSYHSTAVRLTLGK